MAKKINIENRRARFDYDWLDTYMAGIQLQGTEIKSIKEGKVNIAESFCQFQDGELYIVNMNIDPYSHGNRWNHSERRTRKLLLQKKELKKLEQKTKNSSLTIIPTKLFINDKGLAKLNIALAKGRKKHDKRQVIKSKDLGREAQRIINNH